MQTRRKTSLNPSVVQSRRAGRSPAPRPADPADPHGNDAELPADTAVTAPDETDRDQPRLRWGILSTGFIADSFATGVEHSRTGCLHAVASRSAESARQFAAKHPTVARSYDRYEGLLEDPDVDAVYIAPPHPFHREWAVRAAEAGKAVLCEKPIGMDFTEAEAIVEAARLHGVFLMEGYMYRCAPQTRRLIDIVRSGRAGEIRAIDAVFSFRAPFDPDGRLFNRALGGGGILDVGGYPITMARLVAGLANGAETADPDDFKAVGHLGPTGVDEQTTAVARFPGGLVARLTCGVAVEQGQHVCLYGTEGRIEIPEPWIPAKFGGSTDIVFHPTSGEPEVIRIDSPEHLYGIEADVVAHSLPSPQAAWPAVDWEESLATMRLLDRWKAEIGLTY